MLPLSHRRERPASPWRARPESRWTFSQDTLRQVYWAIFKGHHERFLRATGC